MESPEEHQERLRLMLDRFIRNMGLLRVMFRSAAQKDMCPPVHLIAADIVEKWGLTDPKDVNAVTELLVMSQPSAGRCVADYHNFCRLLKKHGRDRQHTLMELVLQRQQDVLRPGKPKDDKPLTTRRGAQSAMLSHMETAIANPKKSVLVAAAFGPAAVLSDNLPLPPSKPLTDPNSRAAWCKWLRHFADPKDPDSLTWTQFSRAVDHIPPQTNATLRIDHWNARQFFAAIASNTLIGGNYTAATSTTTNKALPISQLVQVFSCILPINESCTAASSREMKNTLEWRTHDAFGAKAPWLNSAGARDTEATLTPRKPLSARVTRASVLRNAQLKLNLEKLEANYAPPVTSSLPRGRPLSLSRPRMKTT